MVWFPTDDDEITAIQELNKLPDRAMGIVAGALLERRLEIALKQSLRDAEIKKGESVHGRMFHASAPLGSFSAKIDMGFMISLYSAGARKDLVVIKDIRNRFAHWLKVRSFDDVKDLCDNLTSFEKHFFEYGGVPTEPHPNPMMAQPDLQASLSDPRRRFFMAVELYCTALTVRSTPPGL